MFFYINVNKLQYTMFLKKSTSHTHILTISNGMNMCSFASKGYPFKNIFDFTTAGDRDCVAVIERLPALHYSVDFIFLSFGIMGFIVEL